MARKESCNMPVYQCFLSARYALLLLSLLFWLLSGPSLQVAQASDTLSPSESLLLFPANLGQVVYQSDPGTASNIYIIANAHRSALSGANAVRTAEAQYETFLIGEWLINQQQISLLLPEGFFGTVGGAAELDLKTNRLDIPGVQGRLADTSVFVNAEMLLHKNYGIGMDQIEDNMLYLHTRERLRASLGAGGHKSSTNSRELSHLQRLRTANILQTAPAVIDSAYRQERISRPNAMLTIGISHLEDILGFLEAGKINIAALNTASGNFPAQETDLELLKQQIGVTVIVPRVLIAQQQRAL